MSSGGEREDMAGSRLPRLRHAQHVTALRYFHEVARSGSIRVASEILNVAPSAISRQISKLESEVGEPLFERRPRGMILTAAGEAFDAYALNTLLSLRRLHSEIDGLRGLKTGEVRIATIEGLVASFLSRAISDFRRESPGISFRVTITSADDVLEQLRTGAADIGLAFNAPAVRGIHYARRIHDPVSAVMAPTYPLAGERRLVLRELMDIPLAVPVRSFGIRNLVDQAFREERLAVSPALETNSIESLRAFARHGDGIAFLHYYAIERELGEGQLIAREVDAPALRAGTIDICLLSEGLLSVAAREFAAFVADRMPPVQSWPAAC